MSKNRNPIWPTEEQIRERAYEIYLAGGSEYGHDLSDWLTAERELKELSAQAPMASKKGPISRHSK